MTPALARDTMAYDNETYTFEASIKHATSKAVLVEPTIGPDECWIPRSQIREQEGHGESWWLNVPLFGFVVSRWIARKNGLTE